MSAIIYEKQPLGLYATGDRTVSTFPSGLVRVEQTFVCRTSAAATHRAALAVGTNMPGGSAPAIDGLKIFPEPQEKHRDDGFTEFIVSAYGRTSITPREKIYYEYQSSGFYLSKSKKALITYVTNYQNSQVLQPNSSAYKAYKISASNNDFSAYPNNYWVLQGISEIDFGHFKEVSLNYISEGY